MIGAQQLRAQVATGAPYLLQHDLLPTPVLPAASADALAWGAVPTGFLGLLRTPTLPGPDAYFALCCAAHHGTVGGYVPTDVDSKIRGSLWRDGGARGRSRRAAFALAARAWQRETVSTRVLPVGAPGDTLSGHDGEWLAVLIGAHGATGPGEEALAETLGAAIDAELARQARLFRQLDAEGPLEAVLAAAAILTHNAGDCDQGLSYATRQDPAQARWRRLAHEEPGRLDGAFARAAAIYRATLAAEGHRHYPLRGPRCLRRDPRLLLPFAPFLEAWGALIATTVLLREDERLEVAAALLDGCRTIAGQQGYFRALRGLTEAWPGGAQRLARALPAAARRVFDDAATQRALAVRDEAFRAALARRVPPRS